MFFSKRRLKVAAGVLVTGSAFTALASLADNSHSRTALNSAVPGAKPPGISARQDLPDPKTVLPPPQVEMDVVNILSDFPRDERPYIQLIVHSAKDLQQLNKQCTRKAALFAEKGTPKHVDADSALDADGYLRYFDPLRSYLRLAYKRAYAVKPPLRFDKAHKYWLAYLAYALENLDQQRHPKGSTQTEHSPIAVAQYRAWACRLYKENGLDLSAYMLN